MADQELPRITPEDVHRAVSRRLAKAFDAVAKGAMQAAAMARDPSVQMMDKLDGAHARVTLIVETAVRGLCRASRTAIGGVARVLVEDDEDEDGDEDSPS
jgi:hypothetical protein